MHAPLAQDGWTNSEWMDGQNRYRDGPMDALTDEYSRAFAAINEKQNSVEQLFRLCFFGNLEETS